jgi:penicillin-binding protein 1A
MADKFYRNKVKKKNLSPIFKLLIVCSVLGLGLIAGAIIAFFAISNQLPDVNQIKNYSPDQTSIIYDSQGNILGKVYNEANRVVIPLNEIPNHVKQAVISMEDERFYEHGGIDNKAMLRSVVSLIPGVNLVRGGGSTLTQQLARNLFLTKDVKISRKVAEIFMAKKIENVLSKDKILELYLNEVYWGHNAYGVEAISRVFFNKSVKNLNLAEASMIGGLLSSPEYYSPYRSLKLAKWRQSLTLQNMVKNKYITQEEASKAKEEKVYFAGLSKNYKIAYPYFTSYVLSILREKYDDNTLRTAGLKIYTTIDPEAQAYAEKLISSEISSLRRRNITQGALLSVDPNNGYIKTIVGGVDFNTSEYNRITQAKRQPGSSFKPFVYLTAFEKKILNPYSIVVDEPISYPQGATTWSPKNYDGTFRGSMTVIDAVKKSINTVAVKTLEKVGTKSVIETARKLGIESELQDNLSLSLGSSEVNPMELAYAYGVIATGGNKVKKLTPILKIIDKDGNVIEDNTKYIDIEKVYNSESIDMTLECMKGVVSNGSGKAAAISGRDIAGKTGTTSDNKDSWFVGFTPQLVTLVWVGNDNNTSMIGASGGGICAPIWKKYMVNALSKYPTKKFNRVETWKSKAVIVNPNSSNNVNPVVITEVTPNPNTNPEVEVIESVNPEPSTEATEIPSSISGDKGEETIDIQEETLPTEPPPSSVEGNQ